MKYGGPEPNDLRRREWASEGKHPGEVFPTRNPAKQGGHRAEQAQATVNDYATGEGKEKSHPRNQKPSRTEFGKVFTYSLFTIHFSLNWSEKVFGSYK